MDVVVVFFNTIKFVLSTHTFFLCLQINCVSYSYLHVGEVTLQPLGEPHHRAGRFAHFRILYLTTYFSPSIMQRTFISTQMSQRMTLEFSIEQLRLTLRTNFFHDFFFMYKVAESSPLSHVYRKNVSLGSIIPMP